MVWPRRRYIVWPYALVLEFPTGRWLWSGRLGQLGNVLPSMVTVLPVQQQQQQDGDHTACTAAAAAAGW